MRNIFGMSNKRLPRDRVIKREQAEPILVPHLCGIQRACLRGMESFREFADTMPNLRIALKERTVAGFINDWVVQHARVEFPLDKQAGVEPFEERCLFGIGFGRKLLLRFKKSDEDDLTHNYPTRQQKESECQQLLIDGWEEATWVSACYHYTPAVDSIDRIIITCRHFGHLLWAIPVYDAGEGEEEGVLPYPGPKPIPPQPRKSRVVPKDLTKPEGE